MKKKLISVEDKGDYIVRVEEWTLYGEEPVTMTSAYNHDGDYIGSLKVADLLTKKYGIKPELIDEDHTVCSIGFSEKDQKWYGWSHRAICGFGIGDKIFAPHYGDENTLFTQHGEKTITTMQEAKLAAINFANHVA